MGLGPYLAHFVELSGVSSREQTDLSSYPPPLSQSAAHLVWGPHSNVDFPAARKMQVLFLEGEASLQDREKKSLEIWKAEPAAFTFSFQQAETCHSLGKSQASFHRACSLSPSGHRRTVVAGLPSGSWSLFCFGARSGGWSLAEVSRGG